MPYRPVLPLAYPETYCPEFGTTGNARRVVDAMVAIADKIEAGLERRKPVRLTEQEQKLILFALNRAMECIPAPWMDAC